MARILDPEGAHLPALRRLGAFAGRRVLEFGCGDGRLTLGIAPDAGSVFAFDADAARCRQKLAERVAFGVATAHEIELETRSFDLTRGVERELVGVEVDDAHMLAHRIEATDLGEGLPFAHQTGITRGRPAPAPVLDEVTTAAMRLILSGEQAETRKG